MPARVKLSCVAVVVEIGKRVVISCTTTSEWCSLPCTTPLSKGLKSSRTEPRDTDDEGQYKNTK